ncbi:MAG: adenosylmethionine decarboxylase [Litoreibacter sp.]
MNIRAPFPVLGKHLIADFYGARHLVDHKPAEAIFAQAAKKGGATLLGIEMHDFGERSGFTGVAILAESHISIHTWPEHQHAAIDIFMCGDADPRLSLAVLEHYFQPSQSDVQLIERGARATTPMGAL